MTAGGPGLAQQRSPRPRRPAGQPCRSRGRAKSGRSAANSTTEPTQLSARTVPKRDHRQSAPPATHLQRSGANHLRTGDHLGRHAHFGRTPTLWARTASLSIAIKLSVVEMPAPTGNRRSVELEASGQYGRRGSQLHRPRQSHHLRRGQRLADSGRRRPQRRRAVSASPSPVPRCRKPRRERSSTGPRPDRFTVDGARFLESSQFPGGNGKQ